MGKGDTADIVLVVNMTIFARKVPTHLRLKQLVYNQKGNLCRFLEAVVISSMILPAMKRLILMTVRRIDLTIIDVTGDQRLYSVQFHSIEMKRYVTLTGGIELLHEGYMLVRAAPN